MTEVLRLYGVTKSYGALRALDGIDLAIPGIPTFRCSARAAPARRPCCASSPASRNPITATWRSMGAGSAAFPCIAAASDSVFQNFALFPHLSVSKNIAFGLENRETGAITDRKQVRERVRAMIDLVGLNGLEDRGVGQISGGQKQRVALARTLVVDPRLGLLDEPLGALDANLRKRMRSNCGDPSAARCRLHPCHGNEIEALAMGDLVVVLDRGRIIQVADPDTVYNQPAAPWSRAFSTATTSSTRCRRRFLRGPAGRFAPGRACGSRPIGRPMRCATTVSTCAPRPRRPQTTSSASRRPLSRANIRAPASICSSRPTRQVIEVEAHLSHRAPAEYQRGSATASSGRRRGPGLRAIRPMAAGAAAIIRSSNG